MTLRAECKAWAVISVGALAIAGVFALLLVLSRTPGVQDILPWPWKSFFHKGLVTHVIFSFVVWFLATMGAFMAYGLAKAYGGGHPSGLGRPAIWLSYAGCLGLILPALLDWGTAELNNYVPVMNHPLYYGGLMLLALGLALVCLRQLRLSFDRVSDDLRGLDLTGVIYLIALVCFGLAYVYLPSGLPDPTFNERLFWGGGHVLQFVNTALLIVAWAFLVRDETGHELLSAPVMRLVFALLLVFSLPGALIYPFYDVLGQVHRDFYTDMLRYGLPLSSTVATYALVMFLLSEPAQKMTALSRQALWLSLITYNLGGLFGLLLDGTDTRVPAHYHAVIGGINLAFMIFYHKVLLAFIGADLSLKKWGKRLFVGQYWLYGLGQIMHASGMFLAGSQGVPRKTAGAAQSLDSIEKILSMTLMGVGGLIAVAGGVLFVIMTLTWIVKAKVIDETQ